MIKENTTSWFKKMMGVQVDVGVEEYPQNIFR